MRLKTFLTLNSLRFLNLNSLNLLRFVQSSSLSSEREQWSLFHSFSLSSSSVSRRLHHVAWFHHLQLTQIFSKCFKMKWHFEKDQRLFDHAHCVQVMKMTCLRDWIRTALMYEDLCILIWFEEIISCTKSTSRSERARSACSDLIWTKIVSCSCLTRRQRKMLIEAEATRARARALMMMTIMTKFQRTRALRTKENHIAHRQNRIQLTSLLLLFVQSIVSSYI